LNDEEAILENFNEKKKRAKRKIRHQSHDTFSGSIMQNFPFHPEDLSGDLLDLLQDIYSSDTASYDFYDFYDFYDS
jgi:hypothetical protein